MATMAKASALVPALVRAIVPAILIALTLSAGAALAGCGKKPQVATDMAVAMDMARTTLNLTGKFATQLTLNLGVTHGDGGASTTSSMQVLAVWGADQYHTTSADGTYEVDSNWQFCTLKLPDGLDAPYDDFALAALNYYPKNGALAGLVDGSKFTQSLYPFVGGAKLSPTGMVTDPLPVAGAPACSDTVTSGCVQPTSVNGTPVSSTPGVRVNATGLTPDASVLWIDFRFALAFDASAKLDSTLNGTIDPSTTLEYHILSCQLRTGALCSPTDVAALEAARARITVTGGQVRSFQQQFYFNCMQLMSDTQGSLTGTEAPPDGGAPLDLGTVSFSLIQDDMDQFGCATCHQSISGPGKLQLVLKPWTAELLRQNYLAVLPFTQPDAVFTQPGGRFVNQVPIPDAMRVRWLRWVAAGTPP
jgi:hypothetical protein